MRITVGAVFFLAMVPLGLTAAEVQTTGHRTTIVEDTTPAGEAQHRRLSRGGGKGGRGRRTPNNYDDDSLIGTTSTSVELVETPAPSTTHPEPCLTREPSTTAPALSLTPAPSTTAPVRSTMAPVPAMADPVPRRTPEPLTTPTDMDILLDLHNEARCLHNADPLTYSDEVATSAMAHAQVLSGSCGQLFHSESEDRNGYGENLYLCGTSSTTSCYTPEAAMASLYENEIQVDYVAQYGGHATQILWKSTTELGCALATCHLDPFHFVYLVCQYNPPGNILGNLEDEVELPSGDFC